MPKVLPHLSDLPDQTDLMFRDKLNIYQRVHQERVRSIEKHGSNAQDNLAWHDPKCFYNLVEEVGEVANALTYDSSKGLSELQKELIQVAAMAIAWADTLDF